MFAPLPGGITVGRRLAKHKVRAVWTSRHPSVLDPATSLRYALDDVGWGMSYQRRLKMTLMIAGIRALLKRQLYGKSQNHPVRLCLSPLRGKGIL